MRKGGEKMNKKMVKIVNICLIAMVIISTASTAVFALEPGNITAKNAVTGSTQIENVGKSIVGILQTVGIVLSVVVLIVLGIKYMMGSAEEKAEYKKTMMPYLVGAALIFAASALAQVVFKFFTGISAS